MFQNIPVLLDVLPPPPRIDYLAYIVILLLILVAALVLLWIQFKRIKKRKDTNLANHPAPPETTSVLHRETEKNKVTQDQPHD